MQNDIDRIRTFARAGLHDTAWAALERALTNRTLSPADPEVRTLRARLLKDRALLAHGEERLQLLHAAAAQYADCIGAGCETYPMINAAALHVLAGDEIAAARLAQQVLHVIENGGHAPETAYWLAATRAEALLILHRNEEARAALHHALTLAPAAYEDQASTLRQWRSLLTARGAATDWLDALRSGPSWHFAGPTAVGSDECQIGRQIDAVLAEHGATRAFGALAAGFDIIAAERFVRHGAALSITLPCDTAEFIERSVRPAGDEWVRRFDALAAAAQSFETLDEVGGFTPAALCLADQMSIGLAAHDAMMRDARGLALRETGVEAGPHLPLDRITVTRSAALPAAVPPLPEDSALLQAALGCDESRLCHLPATMRKAARRHNGYAWCLFDALPDAAEQAATLFLASGENAHICLDYGVMDADRVSERQSTLAALPPTGHIVASAPAARALSLIDPNKKVAMAGSVSIAGRDTDYYSLLVPA